MEKHSRIDYSIPYQPNTDFINIGSVEETVWSLRISMNAFEHRWVEIFRFPAIGEVDIDILMNQDGRLLLSREEYSFLDGQKTARFRRPYASLCAERFGSISNLLTGYIIVHYTSNGKLSNKRKAVTQAEIGFISSTAEKINPLPQLANDLLHLLENPDSFSDATFVCGTTKIRVHRLILSARSPVFAAMFKTRMKEDHERVVDIVDMKLDVLQAMLRYVYSGKTDLLTCSLAGDLLFAADKYHLEELKLICVEELKSSMAVKNAFNSLVLGDMYDKSLKAHALEFIYKCAKFSDLEKTEEWQSLLKKRSLLAVEVLTNVVKHLEEKNRFVEQNFRNL